MRWDRRNPNHFGGDIHHKVRAKEIYTKINKGISKKNYFEEIQVILKEKKNYINGQNELIHFVLTSISSSVESKTFLFFLI